MRTFHLFPTNALARKYHTVEKTIPLCHIYAISVTRYIERTELQSRRKGICRHGLAANVSLPTILSESQLSESDLWPEISVAIIEVRRPGNRSGSAYCSYQHTWIRAFYAYARRYHIGEQRIFVIDNNLWANSLVTKRVEVFVRNATAKHACITWLDRTAIFKVKSSNLSNHRCFFFSAKRS